MFKKRILGATIAGGIALLTCAAAVPAVQATETQTPCSEKASKDFGVNCNGWQVNVRNKFSADLNKMGKDVTDNHLFYAPDVIAAGSSTTILGDSLDSLGVEGKPSLAIRPADMTAYYETGSGKTYGVRVDYSETVHVAKAYCGVVSSTGVFDDSYCYFTNTRGEKRSSGTAVSPTDPVKVTFE